jgi:LPPG:FO 2-phospho-L-lactate transferase
MSSGTNGHVLALCGGVGGARLALGLARILAGERLTLAVNVGDDFTYLGLRVCPDLDTVLYTLGGVADPVRGWGIAEDTWRCMKSIAVLGGETWFQLGDVDLATHVERTHRLANGETLSAVTSSFARALGVSATIAPASDDVVSTILHTEEGRLTFQDYFVRRHCEPAVQSIEFAGAAQATPSPAVEQVFKRGDLSAIVICPSNPFLSIDPILAIPGITEALRARHAPSVAVSPLVAGKSVKGPTEKIARELGLCVSNQIIAARYTGLIDGLLIDTADVEAARAVCVPTAATGTLMTSMADRERVAETAIRFAAGLKVAA